MPVSQRARAAGARAPGTRRDDGIELEDALRIVKNAARERALPAIDVELDAALGRVLARDAGAARALPPFDSSAMDGFAVRAADVATASDQRPVALRIAGESRAGTPARAALAAGEAIAISTGAVMPEGADAVVRVERTGAREDGFVSVLAAVVPGAEVRRAGEDVRAGEVVLACGTVLGPAEVGMLAALGFARARCARAPRVCVIATGDELLAPGDTPRDGAIHDSNSHSNNTLARCAGAEVQRALIIPDERAVLERAIADGAVDCDALIICGGVSVGAHDHARPALASLGARELFWGLALKPGHPTWFGTLGERLVFGLPGNPVSAIVTFALLAAPALGALQGARHDPVARTAILDEGYTKAAGRAHALRCRLHARDDGWHAALTGAQGSHVLSSMIDADALAIVPSAVTEVAPGERVQIEPLRTASWARAGA